MPHKTYIIDRPPAPTGEAVHPLRQLHLSPGLSLHPLRKGQAMTLSELSPAYREAAALLRARLRLLRQELARETDCPPCMRICLRTISAWAKASRKAKLSAGSV